MDSPTQLALKAARKIAFALSHGAAVDVNSIAATIDRETKLPQWKAALEDLTPSGSEFVDDPKTCARYVRRRLDDLQDALKRSNIRNRQLSNGFD